MAKNKEIIRCKDCEYFERLKWHKCLSKDNIEEPQLLGNCPILLNILKMDNSSLWAMEQLHIQDSFGCIFGIEKDTK